MDRHAKRWFSSFGVLSVCGGLAVLAGCHDRKPAAPTEQRRAALPCTSGTCPTLAVSAPPPPATVNAGLQGGTLTFTGSGFLPSTTLTVWLDADRNGQLDNDELMLLTPPMGGAAPATDAAGTLGPTALVFAGDVAAGSYPVYAGVCSGTSCKVENALATTTVTITMGISHSKFGSGSTLTVTGFGLPASTAFNIWYDTASSGTFTTMRNTVSVTTDGSGAFSTPIVINGAPTIDALWAALSGQSGVAIQGDFFVHAGPATGTAATATVAVHIDSCWFQECLIYDAAGQGADTICLFGNSPQDFFSLLPDCKSLDVSYTETGYDLTNAGPRFAGAGQLTAALNDLGPPGTACAAMTAAIVNAEANYHNAVPDKVSLLAIACGTFFTPPLDLGVYDFFAGDTPDSGVVFAAVAAINAAAFAAGGAVLIASATTFAAGALFSAIVGPAVQAALGVSGVDPATATALGTSAATVVVGIISTAGLVAGALAPVVTAAILVAAQNLLAEAAVAGAIACGYVNSYCEGSDITATIIAHPELQKAPVPVPFLQPPFKPAPANNPCPDPNVQCWGQIIGWSKVTCFPTDVPSSCDVPGPKLAMPGTAGANNEDVPEVCAVGQIVGLSIGYDGDVSFDVGNDPSVDKLTNYHNYLPGPGGTEPPNGIDVEIPIKNPLNDPALLLRSSFAPLLGVLRKGMEVKVCGRWVADMHMLWNEIHPVTSLSLLPEFTVAAAPVDVTIQRGETASYALLTTLNSGPSAPVGLTIQSALPMGAVVTFSPATVTPTGGAPVPSVVSISNVPVGEYKVVVQGTSGEVVRTTTVNLHVYDYLFAVAPPDETPLRGGAAAFGVTALLFPGSSSVGVPAVTLGAAGLPGDAQPTFGVATTTPTFAGAATTLAVAAAPPPGGSLGDFSFTVTGTNPTGTIRSSDATGLHLYDFAVSSGQPIVQVLTTGANTDPIAVALAPGSTTRGLPTLALSASGAPAGVTASFTPTSGPAAGFASTLALTAAGAAPNPGTPLTITGTDARAPEGGSRSTTATVVVLTPAQAIAQVVTQIAALKAAHVLNNGQANSLTTKLQHAIASLGANPDRPTACNQLNAFVNEVTAYVAAGILTPAQAAQLLDPPLGINAIRAAIPC